MNKIYIKVKKSNLKDFEKDECYEINLMKCIGSGSYGYIFLTDINNLVAKIIVEFEKEDDRISDYLETDVLDKLIYSKVLVNNRDYGYGELLSYEKYSLLSKKRERKRMRRSSSIILNLNYEGDKNPIESRISNSGKTKSFYLYEGATIILMPLFVSFYDYSSIFRKKLNNEKVLCNIIKMLIDATDELLLFGFINIDLKMNNVMIDRNNSLKVIDFGLVVSERRLMEKMDLNIRYYIWPRNENFTYGMIMSYMVVVFILEIIFEDGIYSLHKKNNLISIIENNIKLSKYFSEYFKEVIIAVLKDGLEFKEFKVKMEVLFKEYNIKKGCLPNLYEYILWSKGLDIY